MFWKSSTDKKKTKYRPMFWKFFRDADELRRLNWIDAGTSQPLAITIHAMPMYPITLHAITVSTRL